MSLLSRLFRNPSTFNTLEQCSLRRKMPKISARTYRKRKELKRLKYINQYSAEYTGEGPYHAWMDPKRTKAFYNAYQDFRNRHRYSCPVDEKDKKIIEEKMKEYEKFYYHKDRTEDLRRQKLYEKTEEARKEIENLPYYLRDEMKPPKSTRIQLVVPERFHFGELYFEQIIRTAPEEYALRYLAGKRLEKVMNDDLEMGE